MKKLIWADILRALSIFLIVVIHTTTLSQGKSFTSLLESSFYGASAIGISLFIMVSGALLLGKKESYSAFFYKRFKKVFIPWILWTLIYISIAGVMFTPKQFLVELLSRFWFLPVILGIYLVTPILRIFIEKARNKDIIYFLVLWFAIALGITFIRINLGHNFPIHILDLRFVIFQFLGVFVLGYLLTKLPRLKKFRFWIIFLPIGIFFARFEIAYLPLQHFRLVSFPYNYMSPEILLSATAVFMAVYIYFEKKRVSPAVFKFISSVSGASLGIYLVHELVRQLLFPKLDLSSAFPLVQAVILFILSYLLVILFKKIPIVKLLVP